MDVFKFELISTYFSIFSIGFKNVTKDKFLKSIITKDYNIFSTLFTFKFYNLLLDYAIF